MPLPNTILKSQFFHPHSKSPEYKAALENALPNNYAYVCYSTQENQVVLVSKRDGKIYEENVTIETKPNNQIDIISKEKMHFDTLKKLLECKRAQWQQQYKSTFHFIYNFAPTNDQVNGPSYDDQHIQLAADNLNNFLKSDSASIDNIFTISLPSKNEYKLHRLFGRHYLLCTTNCYAVIVSTQIQQLINLTEKPYRQVTFSQSPPAMLVRAEPAKKLELHYEYEPGEVSEKNNEGKTTQQISGNSYAFKLVYEPTPPPNDSPSLELSHTPPAPTRLTK